MTDTPRGVIDDEGIPDFLKLTPEERRKAWEGRRLTDPNALPKLERRSLGPEKPDDT